MINGNKNKKVFFNIIYSFLSSFLPLFVLQGYIMPIIADKLNQDLYGIFLTQISWVSIVPGSISNALNNIRLINNNEFEKNKSGAFNILFILILIISLILLKCILQVYKFDNNIFIYIYSSLVVLYGYYSTFQLIDLEYKRIFIASLLLVAGYFLGLRLFLYNRIPIIIYVMGYSFSSIIILYKNKLLKEGLKIDKKIIKYFLKTIVLSGVTILGNIINYADRVLIYPILGATAVSIYYTATVMGKIIITGIGPINSVILSYISKDKIIDISAFKKLLISSGLLSFVFYFLSIGAAAMVIPFLYPEWGEISLKYIGITTLTSIVGAIERIVSPYMLKFCKLKWQVIVNICFIIGYIGTAYCASRNWGLLGFCYAAFVCSLFKMVFMLVVVLNKIREENVCVE